MSAKNQDSIFTIIINMRLIIKPDDDINIHITEIDVNIDATIDHVISMLTMKYNNIDATELILTYKGKVLPFDKEVLSVGLTDGCEVLVGFRRRCGCYLL